MQSNGETAHFMQSSSMQNSAQNVTVFDADSAPRTFALTHFGKPIVTFGRQEDNDIVLASPLVSRHHGRFVLINGIWRIEDTGSMNGLLYHHTKFQSREISSGDFIRIDDGMETVSEGVLFVFSSAESRFIIFLDFIFE